MSIVGLEPRVLEVLKMGLVERVGDAVAMM